MSEQLEISSLGGEVMDEASELTPLSEPERRQLIALEGQVRQGVWDVAGALRQIRDRQLFRETHRFFGDYLRDRWGYTLQWFDQLMRALVFREEIETSSALEVLPTAARTLDPLRRLPTAELRVAAWDEAVTNCPGRQPQRDDLDRVVDQKIEEQGIVPKLPQWRPMERQEAEGYLQRLPLDHRRVFHQMISEPGVSGEKGLEMLRRASEMPVEEREEIVSLYVSGRYGEKSEAKTRAAGLAPEPDPRAVRLSMARVEVVAALRVEIHDDMRSRISEVLRLIDEIIGDMDSRQREKRLRALS